ncbi:MAG: hypothetical protein COB65_10845, partial [Thalassobium sp.]
LHFLLKQSPNQFMTPLAFREAVTLQLVLWGNAYVFADRGPGPHARADGGAGCPLHAAGKRDYRTWRKCRSPVRLCQYRQ